MLEYYFKEINEECKKLDPEQVLLAMSKLYEDIYLCDHKNSHKLLAAYSVAKELQKKGFDTGVILKAIEAQITSNSADPLWYFANKKLAIIKRNNDLFKTA